MKTQLEFYIEEIEGRLKRLHELVKEALQGAMGSFRDLDQGKASEVKKMSHDIEEMAEKIEENVFETIARRQPVAGDLRKLSTYLQVEHALHRIGRYAYKVAHITTLCEGIEHFKELESLPYLMDLAIQTLEIAMKAVTDEDLSEIDKLEKLEADSDKETSSMFEEIADFLHKRQDITTMAMFYVIVGRYFERAADQAFYVAERAVYMVTGKRTQLGRAYKGSAAQAPH
ncbi:hypothetical protein EU546_07270 [Candidatus Thorarchaeota archaeon]|nr:MAG: hypothetical protein EU546_07270 [Candidatus Thorarchaeota archaeon]